MKSRKRTRRCCYCYGCANESYCFLKTPTRRRPSCCINTLSTMIICLWIISVNASSPSSSSTSTTSANTNRRISKPQPPQPQSRVPLLDNEDDPSISTTNRVNNYDRYYSKDDQDVYVDGDPADTAATDDEYNNERYYKFRRSHTQNNDRGNWNDRDDSRNFSRNIKDSNVINPYKYNNKNVLHGLENSNDVFHDYNEYDERYSTNYDIQEDSTKYNKKNNYDDDHDDKKHLDVDKDDVYYHNKNAKNYWDNYDDSASTKTNDWMDQDDPLQQKLMIEEDRRNPDLLPSSTLSSSSSSSTNQNENEDRPKKVYNQLHRPEQMQRQQQQQQQQKGSTLSKLWRGQPFQQGERKATLPTQFSDEPLPSSSIPGRGASSSSSSSYAPQYQQLQAQQQPPPPPNPFLNSESASSGVTRNRLPIHYQFQPKSIVSSPLPPTKTTTTTTTTDNGDTSTLQQTTTMSPRNDRITQYTSTFSGHMKLVLSCGIVGAMIGIFIGKSIGFPQLSTYMSLIFVLSALLLRHSSSAFGEFVRALGMTLILLIQRSRSIRNQYPTSIHIKAILFKNNQQIRRRPFPPISGSPWSWKQPPPRTRDDVPMKTVPYFNMMYTVGAMCIIGALVGGNMPLLLLPTWLGSMIGSGLAVYLTTLQDSPVGDLARTAGMRVVALVMELYTINIELDLFQKTMIIIGKVYDKLMILDRKHRIKDRIVTIVLYLYQFVSRTILDAQQAQQARQPQSGGSRSSGLSSRKERIVGDYIYDGDREGMQQQQQRRTSDRRPPTNDRSYSSYSSAADDDDDANDVGNYNNTQNGVDDPAYVQQRRRRRSHSSLDDDPDEYIDKYKDNDNESLSGRTSFNELPHKYPRTTTPSKYSNTGSNYPPPRTTGITEKKKKKGMFSFF